MLQIHKQIWCNKYSPKRNLFNDLWCLRLQQHRRIHKTRAYPFLCVSFCFSWTDVAQVPHLWPIKTTKHWWIVCRSCWPNVIISLAVQTMQHMIKFSVSAPGSWRWPKYVQFESLDCHKSDHGKLMEFSPSDQKLLTMQQWSFSVAWGCEETGLALGSSQLWLYATVGKRSRVLLKTSRMIRRFFIKGRGECGSRWTALPY